MIYISPWITDNIKFTREVFGNCNTKSLVIRKEEYIYTNSRYSGVIYFRNNSSYSFKDTFDLTQLQNHLDNFVIDMFNKSNMKFAFISIEKFNSLRILQ